MKGDSEITVNQDTACAAMQMYMDSIFASGKSPVVASVAAVKGDGYGTANSTQFLLKLSERKESAA